MVMSLKLTVLPASFAVTVMGRPEETPTGTAVTFSTPAAMSGIMSSLFMAMLETCTRHTVACKVPDHLNGSVGSL
jgi:hypothetical protein